MRNGFVNASHCGSGRGQAGARTGARRQALYQRGQPHTKEDKIQFATNARGACVTASAPRTVTIDVSPKHMLNPVRLFSRIMWMKNTMPGASTWELSA